MMEIRLIAADLDGTLLNEAGEVSELTQRVLLRAQRDGIRIVWATGRDLPHFATVREALHTDIFAQNFYIALNGALKLRDRSRAAYGRFCGRQRGSIPANCRCV